MNTNVNSDLLERVLQKTPAGDLWYRTPVWEHVLFIAILTFLIHFLVKLIHRASEALIRNSERKKGRLGFVSEKPKFVTIVQLAVSAITFALYFLAVGLILVATFKFKDDFLKTYLSSAAVIGLALSFGLQGMVQDVVTGLTLILSDAIEVGDIVDLSGTIGRVQQIGLRFTRIVNFYNQDIFVPNRNIGNVARFPTGGVFAYADIQVARDADQSKVDRLIHEVGNGTWKQYGAIILEEPEFGKIEPTDPAGWNFLRVKFKVWPGQTLIETTFRSQMVSAMKQVDPNYADWMVSITYRAITKREGASTEIAVKK